jgi:hypothetical protein
MSMEKWKPQKTSPTVRSPEEQEIVDILTQNKSVSEIKKAGGAVTYVTEEYRTGHVIVETEIAKDGKNERVLKAMEDAADLLKNHGISCEIETDFNRCNCPQRVILTCNPRQHPR